MSGGSRWRAMGCFVKTGREEEEEESRSTLRRTLNYGDCGSPVERLWVKIGGVVSKGDLTVGVCYRPPNQNDKGNEAIFGSLKQASGQQNQVLMGDFNYPDICWKNDTAAHMSSIKFLECVEDCCLIQMLDVPTRSEALLDLLLTNQENLLCTISVSASPGCSDHSIVEFGNLLSTLQVRTKTKDLDCRRAHFSSLGAHLGGIPWEASMEDKGASECWEFFKNALLEAQKQFIPFKGKGSRRRKRPPWLNCELLSLLKTKREAYQRWKSGRIPIENYKGIARVCRDAFRKAKAQLKLKLARDIKNYKKGFFRYVSNKQTWKENIGLLLNRRGDVITNNAEKAEVLNTFFTSVFISTVGPQAWGQKTRLMQTQTHRQ